MSRTKRILLSLTIGVFLTMGLTAVALLGKSRQWVCTFAWQGCLAQQVIQVSDDPLHEAGLINLLTFLAGLPLGAPVYSVLAYVLLSIIAKLKK